MGLTTAATAGAQLIYSNGVPDNANGYAVSPPYSAANDFPLLSTTQLGSFDWYVLRSLTNTPNTITSSFDWTVYTDASGQPGSIMANGSVTNATGSKTAFFCCTSGGGHGYDAYLFSGISFDGLSLGSGTYWLGISHYDEPLNANRSYWASSSGFVGNQQGSDDGGTSWYSTDMEGAFSIYGTSNTVPEPAPLALLGTGLVGLFGAARRRGANIS